jgi:hypothetical protein
MAECFELFSKSAEFAGPMFRQPTPQRRKAPALLLRPNSHADGYQQRGILDSSLLAEPCRSLTLINQGIEEPPQPATQTGQSSEAIGIESGDTSRLFASLLFQKIRPCNRRAADTKAASPRTGAGFTIATPTTTPAAAYDHPADLFGLSSNRNTVHRAGATLAAPPRHKGRP